MIIGGNLGRVSAQLRKRDLFAGHEACRSGQRAVGKYGLPGQPQRRDRNLGSWSGVARGRKRRDLELEIGRLSRRRQRNLLELRPCAGKLLLSIGELARREKRESDGA